VSPALPNASPDAPHPSPDKSPEEAGAALAGPGPDGGLRSAGVLTAVSEREQLAHDGGALRASAARLRGPARGRSSTARLAPATLPVSVPSSALFGTEGRSAAADRRSQEAGAPCTGSIAGQFSHRGQTTAHQPRCHGIRRLRPTVLMRRYRARPQRCRILTRRRALRGSCAFEARERRRERGMGLAAKAAHEARPRMNTVASLTVRKGQHALRAALREHQAKRRETRLLGLGAVCCPFGGL